MYGQRTLVLVNLASITERADKALLPAVYREVGAALHATPTGLGALTLYRSIVQAACYPVATYTPRPRHRAGGLHLGGGHLPRRRLRHLLPGQFARVQCSGCPI
jgi:hypothetical protein